MILERGAHGGRAEAWADTLAALADVHRKRRSVDEAGSMAHGSAAPVAETIEQHTSRGVEVVILETLFEAIAVEPARERNR